MLLKAGLLLSQVSSVNSLWGWFFVWVGCVAMDSVKLTNFGCSSKDTGSPAKTPVIKEKDPISTISYISLKNGRCMPLREVCNYNGDRSLNAEKGVYCNGTFCRENNNGACSGSTVSTIFDRKFMEGCARERIVCKGLMGIKPERIGCLTKFAEAQCAELYKRNVTYNYFC